MVAQGASGGGRRAAGTPVCRGRLATLTIGAFMTPMRYVVFQTAREKAMPGMPQPKLPAVAAP